MTVKEFYESIGSDYNKVLRTLMRDSFAEKMILSFSKDHVYQDVIAAVEAKDIKASFTAAHTLKGVAANLGFSRLFAVASQLTEQLRPLEEQANPRYVSLVTDEYNYVMRAIEKFIAEKE